MKDLALMLTTILLSGFEGALTLNLPEIKNHAAEEKAHRKTEERLEKLS